MEQMKRDMKMISAAAVLQSWTSNDRSLFAKQLLPIYIYREFGETNNERKRAGAHGGTYNVRKE